MHLKEGEVLIESLIGVAVGVLTIVLARIIGGQRWLYSLGPLTLPSLYAFFALQAGDNAAHARCARPARVGDCARSDSSHQGGLPCSQVT